MWILFKIIIVIVFVLITTSARPISWKENNVIEYDTLMIDEEIRDYYSSYHREDALNYEIGKLELVPTRTKRAEDNTDVPRTLQLNFSGKSFTFVLHRDNELLSPDFKVVYKGVQQDISCFNLQECLYKGKIIDGDEDGLAAFSYCDKFAMSGVIVAKSNRYIIQPLPKSIRAKRQTANEVVVITPSDTAYQHFCAVKSKPMDKIDESLIKAKREAITKPLTIETAIFADNEMFVWAGNQADTNSMQAITNLVLSIMAGVQTVFDDTSLPIRFKFVIVMLEVIEDTQNAPYPAEGNINSYLTNFCIWQNTKKMDMSRDGLNTWDHAILLTGIDLYSDTKDKNAAGMAWVSGMCRETLACTINEGNTLNSVNAISHEIGHNMGMHHDGENNTCSADDYLMSPRGGPGRTTWSTCSSNYVYSYLTQPYAACLYNDVETIPLYNFSQMELPGERFPIDQQCQAAFGDSFHPYTIDEAPYENICRELWCANETHAQRAHPALVGTTCGAQMMCKGGLCVDSGRTKTTTSQPLETTEINEIVSNVENDSSPSQITLLSNQNFPSSSSANPFVTDSAEVVADTTELVADSAELVTDSAELVADTTELVADTSELVTDSAELVADTTEFVTDSAELVTDSVELVADTVELASDTVELASDTTELASDTTELVTEDSTNNQPTFTSTSTVIANPAITTTYSPRMTTSNEIANEISTSAVDDSILPSAMTTSLTNPQTTFQYSTSEVNTQNSEANGATTPTISRTTEISNNSPASEDLVTLSSTVPSITLPIPITNAFTSVLTNIVTTENFESSTTSSTSISAVTLTTFTSPITSSQFSTLSLSLATTKIPITEPFASSSETSNIEDATSANSIQTSISMQPVLTLVTQTTTDGITATPIETPITATILLNTNLFSTQSNTMVATATSSNNWASTSIPKTTVSSRLTSHDITQTISPLTTSSTPAETAASKTEIDSTGEITFLISNFTASPVTNKVSLPNTRITEAEEIQTNTVDEFGILMDNMNNRDNNRFANGGNLFENAALVQKEEKLVVAISNRHATSYWQQQRSRCSKLCENGIRLVSYNCLTAEGEPSDSCNVALKPDEHSETCNTEPCGQPKWRVISAGPCNVSCGTGTRIKQIVCIVPIEMSNEEFDVVSDAQCSHLEKPEKYETCYAQCKTTANS
ncbi:hypothetical protein CHUAL_014249 [Chamberlinius hualienensis]